MVLGLMAGLAVGAAAGGLLGGSEPARQAITNELNTETLVQNTTNIMQTNTSETVAQSTNIQTLKVVLSNIKGCKFYATQEIDAETVAQADISTQTAADLATSATTHLTNELDSSLESDEGFMSMPSSDQADIRNSINNQITQITERTFKLDNLNKIMTESTNIQDATLTIDGYDCTVAGEIVIDQKIMSRVIAAASVSQILEAIMNDSTIQEAASRATSSSEQTSQGAGEALADVFEGIGAGLFGPMIAAAGAPALASSASSSILCCCLVLFMMMGAMSPAGQGAISKYA